MSRVVSRENTATAARERVPVSANRSPLKVKGFSQVEKVGRWVADIDDRLAEFLQGGYQFISKDSGVALAEPTVSSSTGMDSRMSKPGGRGVTLYLMALPRDLYEADQKAKQAEVDQTEADIKRPGKGAVSGDVDYGKVSISSNRGGERVDFEKF